ncbi:EpsG family protein [Enterobacter sp. P82]|uniref:EpsG family protein n=1 Tax=Enterobacter sp. P82 TaxID=3123033 RepID=UPI00300C31CE
MNTKLNIQQQPYINSLIGGFTSIGLILFLHPLLSIVLISFINVLVKINKGICFLICASYSILIVNREYFIRFSEQSGDDTTRYIPFIKEISNSSLLHALTSQLDVFSIEPFSRFYWWLFSQIGFNVNVILFIQVLIWSICFMVFSIKASERYAVVIFSIGICFFAYTIPYTFYHLYRQAWGLSFFVIYLTLWDKKSRFIFLPLTGLSHIMFIPIVILMEALRKGVRLLFSKYFLPLIVLSFIALYLTYSAIIAKFGAYSEVENINYTPAKYLVYILFFTFILGVYNVFDSKIIKFSDYRFDIYLILIGFYIIGLYPSFSDISNRYVLMLSPLVLMSLTVTKNRFILSIFLILSVSKLLIHLSDTEGNIYQYAMKGTMDFYNIIDSFLFFTGRSL